MHITIGSLYGAATLAAPPKKSLQQSPMGDTATKAETGGSKPIGGKPVKTAPGDNIPLDQVAQKSQQPQLPQHELNVDHPTNMHSPQVAQQQFDMLKQAMGGPQEGFITRTSKSHAVAKQLARSGHLNHIQEVKQGNGHSVHHWALTQKGIATVGQTQNKAGRR